MTAIISADGNKAVTKQVAAPLLSRAARRALKKANRKPGRTIQKHKNTTQILNTVGYVPFAKFIPITDEEHMRMDTFLMIRFNECREGRGDLTAWGCLFSCLLEGWSTAVYSELEGQDSFRRSIKAAARAWDAALLHFNRTGEVLQTNMDSLLVVINQILDLRRQYRRDEMLEIMQNLEKRVDDFVRDIFDGGYPKSGWVPSKLYEEELPKAA